MRRGISIDRVCPFSFGRKKGEKKMNTGLIAIFILLVIIVGAIATRRCVVLYRCNTSFFTECRN